MIRRIHKEEPIAGTIRVVRKFAWLPKEIGLYRIHLRFYEIMQVYRVESVPAIDADKKVVLIKKYWDTIDGRI